MFLSVKWVGETHCTGVSEGIAGLGGELSAPSHVAPGTLLGHYCLLCYTRRQRLGARLAPQGKSCPPLPQRVLPADTGGGGKDSVGGRAHLGGEQAGQVDLREHLLAVALPVGLLGLRQLVRGQDLGGRGWVSAGARQQPLGGPTRDPRAPGSAHSPPRPSPGLGAQPPEAQGGRRPSPLPVRGGHPQGRRQGTHQVEILLCVQVFHCERETHTINKQDTRAGAREWGREQTRNGGRKLEKEPSRRERAQQTCGQETGECKVRRLRQRSGETHRTRLSQRETDRQTSPRGQPQMDTGQLPTRAALTHCPPEPRPHPHQLLEGTLRPRGA